MTSRVNLISITPTSYNYHVKFGCCIPTIHLKIYRNSDRVAYHLSPPRFENCCYICKEFITDRISRKIRAQSNISIKYPTLSLPGYSSSKPSIGHCQSRLTNGYFHGLYCNKPTDKNFHFCSQSIIGTLAQYAEELVRPSS